MDVLEIKDLAETIKQNIGKVIVGKNDVLHKVVVALFAGGHILMEDMPGTGKTTLAKSLAKSLEVKFTRAQFTPDLLPSDLTGINFYSQKESEFVFRPGPVFSNILLADEINRATPRTQSSLLECMEEGQISVDGVTYRLEQPFLVIATQNPIEIQGTFPLPEAQLDRFFMRLSMGYPAKESETDMLSRFINESPLDSLAPVASKEQILQARTAVKKITVSDAVKSYIVDISNASRSYPGIRLGVSPRGSLALMKASQIQAVLLGRDYVTPDDVKAMAVPVLSHRIIGKAASSLKESRPNSEIVAELLNTVAVPTE